MESEKVDRHVRSKVVIEPAAQLPSLVEIIAYLWDDQVCDLNVRLASVPDLLYRLENWLRIRYSDILSDKTGFRAALEIDGYAIEKIIHQRNRIWSIESIGDEYVDEPVLTCFNPDISGELHENRWLIIRIRQTLTAMA